jgi:hypothetical protein
VIAWICDQVGYERGDGGILKGEVYFKAVYWNILSSVLGKVNLRVTQARKAAAGKSVSDDAMDQEEGENAIVAQQSAERDSKAAYIFVMTRLADLIEMKAKTADTRGVDVKKGNWWRWVVGGFFELFRKVLWEVMGSLRMKLEE